jgi:ribosomal protein S18
MVFQMQKYSSGSVGLRKFRRKVFSINQILGEKTLRRNSYKKVQQPRSPIGLIAYAGKRKIKPIRPSKSTIIILKDKPEKTVYNRRILDYKHTGLLQRYIGLGGKILPRRQTKLTAKNQRYLPCNVAVVVFLMKIRSCAQQPTSRSLIEATSIRSLIEVFCG